MAIKREIVGKKIEDMPTSVSYDVTSGTDVTGESFAEATKGESTTTASPVTVSKNNMLAKFIDTAVERDYELSELEKWFLVVRRFKRIGTDYDTGLPAAYRQKAIVSPGDYAPGNQALTVSATLNWVGEKIHGTYDASATGDGFVPETEPPLESATHYKDGDASRSDYRIYYEYEAA